MKTKIERRKIENNIYNRLPDLFKTLTDNYDDREKDIVLLSTLTVLSNCLPNLFGVYDGDEIYPQLYAMIIAPAASGKGVMNHSRVLIEPIHEKIFKESREQYLSFSNRKKHKEENRDNCPEVMVKILPANISTSEMYSFMGNSSHGLLIIESEADTMSNMLKNDWSNYSDVLRKAFHHESISISRKIEKIFVDIKEPKLAMLISGTPNQLQPLIKSKENGLFSRFIIYNFDEISEFKDVFAEKTRSHKKIFENVSKQVFEFYNKLQSLSEPIEFAFTEAQKQKFLERIRPIREDVIYNHSQGFISNVHRHGLIFFRIAMIFTAIRNIDRLHTLKKITCSDTDFMIGLKLTQTLLRHSQYTYNTIDNGDLSIQDENILSELKSKFTTKDAYKAGEKYGVPERTMNDKLSQWRKKRAIKRVKKGEYLLSIM